MKILSLDVSTKTGFAIFEDGKLLETGLIKVEVKDFNVNDFPEKSPLYPYNIIDAANNLATQIGDLAYRVKADLIVIENTVKGRNRHTQRILEFCHKAILERLRGERLKYMDPSEWRAILEVRLSKDDKKNNRLVSQGKKRGRVTRKHLSVRMANDLFNLSLKIKDNDIADAICLGTASYVSSQKQ